jgi:hypothetical protein
MPFTFAHPAAVLPFLKSKRISWSGILLGSMMPDFEYFLRLRLSGEFGHTWWGILYFNLPVGLLLILTFHGIVKEPLVRNSPTFLKQRWEELSKLDFWGFFRSRWYVVLYSLVIGAFTHVLWDSFTHNSTIIVNSLTFLKTPVSLYFESYPLYHILQHVSTGIGLIIMGLYVFRMPASETQSKRDRGFWFWLVIINFIISGGIILKMSLTEEIKIGHLVVIGLGGFLYSLVTVSLAFQLNAKFKAASG